MKSKWKVTSNIVDTEKIYSVYRLRDTAATDHSGNREYAMGWTDDREEAEAVAAKMNEEEENHERNIKASTSR